MCVNGWVGTELDVVVCSRCPRGRRQAVAGGRTCTAAWLLGDRQPVTHNHLETQVPGGGLQRGLTRVFF